MSTWLGLGKKRALSVVVGSLKGRGLNCPALIVPSSTYSRSSGSEREQKLKRRAKARLKSSERGTLTVFVTVPPLKAEEQTRSPDGSPEDASDASGKDVIKRRVKKRKKNADPPSSDRDLKNGNPQSVRPKKKPTGKNDADAADNITETKAAKKHGRRKKATEQTDEMIKDSLLGPFVPFEGTSTHNAPVGEILHNSSFSVDRQDLPEGRFYRLKSPTGSFSFPSVTTVLSNTVEKSAYYQLLKWKLKLTGEHGAKGFNAIRQNTLNSGHNFHKNVEEKLLRLLASQKGGQGGEVQQKLSQKSVTVTPLASAGESKKATAVKEAAQEGVGNGVPAHQNEVRSIEVDCDGKLDVAAEYDPTRYIDESLVDSIVGSDDVGVEVEKEKFSKSAVSDVEESDTALSQTSSPQGYMASIQHVLDDIGEIKALETSVAHLQLGYMGTFDCLAKYRGTLCLIDWKTSSKPKPSLADCYDYPLQAVAYAGAVNQDPNLNLKVLNVLIVIAYASGDPAHAHLVNSNLCRKYWLKWLQRLQKYQTQFSEDLSEVVS